MTISKTMRRASILAATAAIAACSGTADPPSDGAAQLEAALDGSGGGGGAGGAASGYEPPTGVDCVLTITAADGTTSQCQACMSTSGCAETVNDSGVTITGEAYEPCYPDAQAIMDLWQQCAAAALAMEWKAFMKRVDEKVRKQDDLVP